ITKVSYGLFWRCHDLINVNLPESITFIEDFAFFDCISLIDITIPNSVIHIGNATFNLCDSLTAFYGKFASDDNKCLIVDGTIVAFAIGCDAIEYTTPSNVTAIGYCSFEECKNLKHIIISEGVTRIDSGAFCNSNSLETVTIPNSMLTSIAHSIDIFQLCNNLRAFYGKFASNDNRCLIIDNELVCFAPFGMKEYTIPYGITTIGSRSFISCTNITNINIPDSVTSIEYYAFFNCQNLTSITIPVNVSLIEQYSFAKCENLSHVYCEPNTPPIIEENVFTFFTNGVYEKLNCKIYVPRASVAAYKAAEGWKEYADAIEPYDF
ncbi:MAG: leucine-rich repeat domain-containing protein, partial [Alistipes sp.]|nr:leucine-rich repeat domain-containing protein [Alistipes sp.]